MTISGRGKEDNYWAAIFLVPGGAATIMNVKTKVTENITLLSILFFLKKGKGQKASLKMNKFN